ncbi:MAG: ABC transporter ATP-binding protein [Bacteroidia bacterium]|nr:ABC transporter ATP-binding protein [Bacteroidia bacterium]
MMLELNKITKSYDKREVLNNLSLQMNSGEAVAIVGPSGSGKTTLLNIIGGMDTPDSGSVIFDGQSIGKLSNKELADYRNTKIGFIFQMHYLLPQCTVLENILIPTLALKDKIKKKAAYQRALMLIERVGLTEQKDQLPGELSGGECQRTAFVRALINEPKLILADEPTGSLDQETANILGHLLLELNNESNTTLIVVTHSLELANKMETIYQLKNYRLIKQ